MKKYTDEDFPNIRQTIEFSQTILTPRIVRLFEIFNEGPPREENRKDNFTEVGNVISEIFALSVLIAKSIKKPY